MQQRQWEPRRRRGLVRYAVQTSTALVLPLALVALLSLVAPAGAAPACGEPPETVGRTIVGTPCDDVIRAPRSVTTVNGEGGDDTIFGGRGNDHLNGGSGNDRLYGGIGDDQLRGGPDDDRLSGGFGADSLLDGEEGNDFVRGDATIDDIRNTGGGTDTLSYATGVTPGFFDRPDPPDSFPDFSVYDGFPQSPAGRGAYINLVTGRGDNGRAPEGGGYDEDIDGSDFEVVIGTPFADYIVGTGAAQTIYGGDGADVILGGGGADEVFGGAEGDYCEPGTAPECEFDGSDQEVDARDPATVSAGSMAPQEGEPQALYLVGGSDGESLTATYSDPPEQPVRVVLSTDGTTVESFELDEAPDSVLLAGLGGNDSLTASGFPETTSIVLLGGDGGDELTGGGTEDALVDGPGNDTAEAGSGDDAVPNNGGGDDLHAGPGEDLFVSDAVCNGDLLDGGPDRDNANWANFRLAGVSIDMGAQRAGEIGGAGQPQCSSATLLTTLEAIEDTEGSSFGDMMFGDSGDNQLLGRPGPDSYFAAAGDDTILANSGTPDPDPDPVIDCGDGFDTAQIDFPENGPDAAPIACEDVEERAPNSFRPPNTPLGSQASTSTAAAVVPPPRVVRDRRAPQTRLLRRPARVLFTAGRRRAVAFAFSASERGSSFRCKLDRKRFRPCRSPRVYRLKPGRHAFRVFAVDRAGNRDRSPALIRLRIRRR